MIGLAGLLSAFLGVLWRDTPKEAARLGLRIFLALTTAAVLAGWLMYPHPAR